ncbi:MAG: family 16 glycosylhydrolase [Brevefilum sp.]|nr:family 16 glycosylhydrolase [Brevefilum sp.]
MKTNLPFSIKLIACILFFSMIVGALPSTPVGAVNELIIIDDFEDGDVSDWGYFGGNAAGGGYGIADDRPYEGTYYLSTGWGGEGSTSVFYGGLYRNMDNAAQIVPPSSPIFNVWVLNQSNATVDQYTLEITIREDLDGNGWTDTQEDSFRLDTVFTSTDFDDQWTLISAPVSDFTDLYTGGDGTFNGNLDEIVIVISGVSGASGSTVEVDFDLFSFTSADTEPTALVDDFESGLPYGTDANGIEIGFVTFNDPNSDPPVLSTTDSPPAPLPNADVPNNVLQMDLNVDAWAGFVHNFENETVDTWVPQDWSAFEGISFWLYGTGSGTTMFFDVLDNRNPDSTTDDAERWTFAFIDDFSGWMEIQIPFADMTRKEIGNGAPNDGFNLNEVHGYGLGTLNTGGPAVYYMDNVMVYGLAPDRPLTVGFSKIDYPFVEGSEALITVKLSKPVEETVTVQVDTEYGFGIADRDYIPTQETLVFMPSTTTQSFTVQTIDDNKYQGDLGVVLSLSNPTGGAALGLPPIARLTILDNESYDPNLLDDFETPPYLWETDQEATLTNLEIPAGDALALPGQGNYEHVLQASQNNGGTPYSFSRSFPIGQNWSNSGGINFWYYGQNSSKDIEIELVNQEEINNLPSEWQLVWSDEFNDEAGTAPDEAIWGQEYGDGTANGIPGWGNDELEFYTASTDNAALDGGGNLQITAKEADGSLMCYYGPCEYTSARLLTKDRFEVAYGRLEARIKVPEGAGLWPAFWMLGTDLDQVGWPQSGEIDIMEYVGRVPNEIFGTLHGPGYSGGASYGQYYDLGEPVADQFHTFAVEWEPDKIVWLLDGIPFFTATPTDDYMLDKQWVFNHPFYILLNVAVGGNFGGPVGEDTIFPQSMLVDYVRLYQANTIPTSSSASFIDDFTGWQKIELPFDSFVNDTGAALDLEDVDRIAFNIPDGLSEPVMVDQIRLSCPETVMVENTADSGPGSLRNALNAVCADGTITFSPDLEGQTITLLSGPLTLGKNVTIDGSDAPDLTISGNSSDRILIINAGTTAEVSHLILANGYGWQLAGGVLNNGALTLDHVHVTDNVMATDAGDYWQGGGGIYNGDGASLNLIDSSVSGNNAAWSGGGIYAFFNTTTTIERSTISGNTSNDVGGGIRSLGNMTIINSTISGNTATGWHGGAIFMTDGDITINNSTIANNIGPEWAPSTIFIGDYGSYTSTLTLSNTIITSNQWYACEKSASGVTREVISLGHNLVQDDSCSPVESDLIGVDALLGPLADNTGPTLTHALLPGSPAIDAGDDALCPGIDQRGVLRPQGLYCDIGSYESIGSEEYPFKIFIPIIFSDN